MSLIQGHWVVVACAAAIAVALPWKALDGGREPVALPPPAASTEIAFADSGGLSYALTAPPFTNGRLPQAEEAPPGSASAEAQPAPAPAPPPTLVGLVVANRGRAVALARGTNGETLTLARGELVDGWTLVAIARDRAVFERDGTRHTARLAFPNQGTDATAPASAAAMPPVPAVAPATPSPVTATARPTSRNPS